MGASNGQYTLKILRSQLVGESENIVHANLLKLAGVDQGGFTQHDDVRPEPRPKPGQVDYEDKQCETIIKVPRKDERIFLRTFSLLLKNVSNDAVFSFVDENDWFRGLVQTHHRLLYDSFSLGAFVGPSQFIEAYVHPNPTASQEYWPVHRPPQSAATINGQSPSDPDEIASTSDEPDDEEAPRRTDKQMDTVNFQHDVRRLQFYFSVFSPVDNKSKPSRITYRCRLPYANIRNVLIDVTREVNRVYLYLVLNCPISVERRQDIPEDKRTEGGFDCEWIRTTEFAACTREDLGYSTTLLLTLYRGEKRGDHPNWWFNYAKLKELVSRVRARTGVDVWFGQVHTRKRQEVKLPDLSSLHFGCAFALAALFSRGYRVIERLSDAFIERVRTCGSFEPIAAPQNVRRRKGDVQEEEPKTLWDVAECALFDLVNAVDEQRNVSLLPAFNFLFMDARAKNRTLASDMPRGCKAVRKIVLTPTRVVPMPPEIMLDNRVLRTLGAEHTLRVSVRDESMDRLFLHSCSGPVLDAMMDNLRRGYSISNRLYKFLAWSNSQLRDGGCYMISIDIALPREVVNRQPIEERRTKQVKVPVVPLEPYEDPHANDHEVIRQIRDWMGEFDPNLHPDFRCIPKRFARMGQCLTQSQTTEFSIAKYIEADRVDFRGKDIETYYTDGKVQYTFSDGVGRMSLQVASEIREMLELGYAPAALQIRYEGYKGVLSLDATLTEKDIVFRESMGKFESRSSKFLEIVKYSMPIGTKLNRPLVMILDQASDKHYKEHHMKLKKRVLELLETELFTLADSFLCDEACARLLDEEAATRITIDELFRVGVHLTTEPFFRSLLFAVFNDVCRDLVEKCRIPIPFDKGRMMLGVMDESGLLKEDEVHVRYSIAKKGGEAQTLTGRVMVTKNPCMCLGDVRVLNAVEHRTEYFRALVDVIVFPRVGKRPLPDQMAGSDLDGDEYEVVWDTSLFLLPEGIENYPPMDFTKQDPNLSFRDAFEFMARYLQEDMTGKIASAHLNISDKKGLDHSACMSLAKKASLALDFAKTGNGPSPLEGEEIAEDYPDYMLKERQHKIMYRSERLLGETFRKVERVQDIFEVVDRAAGRLRKACIASDVCEVYDADLIHPCIVKVLDHRISQAPATIQEHFARAQEALRDYSTKIDQLLDHYGIADEAQLHSAHMTLARNRSALQEREALYSTAKVVLERLKLIWDSTRERFFSSFGLDAEESRRWDFSDSAIYRRSLECEPVVPEEFEKMKVLASIWYAVAYLKAFGRTVDTKLSFAWIVWDLLKFVKADNRGIRVGAPNYRLPRVDLRQHRCSTDPYIQRFTPLISSFSSQAGIPDAQLELEKYLRKHPPLASYVTLRHASFDAYPVSAQHRTMYYAPFVVLLDWLHRNGALLCDARTFHPGVNLCPLHGTKAPPADPDTDPRISVREACFLFTRVLDWLVDDHAGDRYDDEAAGVVLRILKYLASERFKTRKMFRLVDGEGFLAEAYRGVMRVEIYEDQIQKLYRTAFSTYFHLALTSRCDGQGMKLERLEPAGFEESMDFVEMDPVAVDMQVFSWHAGGDTRNIGAARRATKGAVKATLKAWSGAEEVDYRPTGKDYLVSAMGTVAAKQEMRNLLMCRKREEDIQELRRRVRDNERPLTDKY